MLHKTKEVPKWRIFLSAFSIFSNQINTALVGGLISTIMNFLSIPSWLQPLFWVIGPICGILQPFFGNWTDHLHSRFLNRKVVLIICAFMELSVFTIFGFLYRQLIHPRTLAIILTIGCYFLAYISLNMQMPVSRAIVNHMAGKVNQAFANFSLSLFSSLGQCITYILIVLTSDPFFYACICVVAGDVPTLIFGTSYSADDYVEVKDQALGTETSAMPETEERYGSIRIDSDAPSEETPLLRLSLRYVIASFIHLFKTGGTPLLTCFLFLLIWSAYLPMFPICLSFVAECFYPDDYDEGLRMGALAMVISTIISALFSLIAPKLFGFIQPRFLFAASLFFTTLSTLTFFVLPQSYLNSDNLWLLIVCYILDFGSSFSMLHAVCYYILSGYVPPSDTGLYVGVLNTFAVTGQTLSLLLSSLIQYLIGKAQDKYQDPDSFFQTRHNLQWYWLQSAVLFFFSTLGALGLKENKRS